MHTHILMLFTLFLPGEVRAVQAMSLDREREDSYIITVTARDGAPTDPPGQSTPYDRKYGKRNILHFSRKHKVL